MLKKYLRHVKATLKSVGATFAWDTVGLALFLLFGSLAAFFTILGAPMPILSQTLNENCLLMWGLKTDCIAAGINVYAKDWNICTTMRNFMYAGIAAGFVAVFGSVAALVLGVVMAVKRVAWPLTLPAFIVGYSAAGANIYICYATIMFMRNDMCNTGQLQELGWTWGSGFGVDIVAIAFQLLATSFLLGLPVEFKAEV